MASSDAIRQPDKALAPPPRFGPEVLARRDQARLTPPRRKDPLVFIRAIRSEMRVMACWRILLAPPQKARAEAAAREEKAAEAATNPRTRAGGSRPRPAHLDRNDRPHSAPRRPPRDPGGGLAPKARATCNGKFTRRQAHRPARRRPPPVIAARPGRDQVAARHRIPELKQRLERRRNKPRCPSRRGGSRGGKPPNPCRPAGPPQYIHISGWLVRAQDHNNTVETDPPDPRKRLGPKARPPGQE
ncbi:translation initiation factor IF-2-like [Penaeus japonicus]|uniref:translation initiation factor IF-2-like n=1 Tax=Penaeus japonicus TaxID=27405 RepID=UPI001C7114FE|nr:translation initiation factor IF-2-like [Penaeus japonicus]